MIEDLICQTFFGVAKAAILFLLASGLSVTFGMLNIANFAHGSLFMFGGFFAYFLIERMFGISEAIIWIVLMVVAPALTALLGMVWRRSFVVIDKPMPREIYPVVTLLFTMGWAMIFSDLVRVIFGESIYHAPLPSTLYGSTYLFGRGLPHYTIFAIALGFLLFIILFQLFFRTKIGALVRAIAYDAQTASALGINVKFISSVVFGLGCFLAGLGGALNAMISEVNYMTWIHVIVQAFIVAVIGGLGSFRGTIVGALIVGLTESYAIYLLGGVAGPGIGMMSIFLVASVILAIRPQGIFGGRF